MANASRFSLRLSLPLAEFFQHRKNRQDRLSTTPQDTEQHHHTEYQTRRTSTEDAREWIESTIREEGHWEEHLSLVQIDCPHTMAELRQLGRLPRPDGVKQCRKMIRIPVLYDEIGCFLWEKLAALERGPDFVREDEKRAAEYATEVTCRTIMALDERFRFDKPPPPAAATKKKSRARHDSEPVAPRHMPKPPGHSISPACHFCRNKSSSEHPRMPDAIQADALRATRGRVADEPPTRGPQSRSRSRASRSSRSSRASGLAQPAPGFFNHDMSSSHSNTLLWQRYPTTSAPGSSESPRSAHSRWSRDGSFAGRVGSVVGGLGKGFATAMSGGLSHGYEYGGKADRSASFWTV